MLPLRACVNGGDESKWIYIDGSYEWCFSLRQNDLISFIDKENKEHKVYFNNFDKNTNRFTVLSHDRQKTDKNANDRFSVTKILCMKKYHVDVLGNYYLAKPEPRRELA